MTAATGVLRHSASTESSSFNLVSPIAATPLART